MRLWTPHPGYLDSKGLVALWREGLLARKVLEGKTKGYRNHPQLIRFREQPDPLGAISGFLAGVLDEAMRRGYAFDASKIGRTGFSGPINETEGQLLYEWRHLLGKLRLRAPLLFDRYKSVAIPDPHPLFRIVPGNVRPWEREKR